MKITDVFNGLTAEAKQKIQEVIKSYQKGSRSPTSIIEEDTKKKKRIRDCFNCSEFSIKQNPANLFELIISCPHRNKFLRGEQCYWKNRPRVIPWDAEDFVVEE